MLDLHKNIKEENRLPTTMELFITRLNVQRSLLVAVFALLLQLANLFGAQMREHPSIEVVSGITILLMLTHCIVTLLVYRREQAAVRSLKRLYTVFWILFALQMSPYFWVDVLYRQTPVNMIIFAATLAVCPLFTRKTILRLYPPLLLYMQANTFLAGADISLLLLGLVISAVCIVTAISLQVSFYQIIEDLYLESETDGLTKIYNRKAGTARMESLLALCKRLERDVAVFFIDIDHFKNYNDTYGHLKGDETLSVISECVRQCFSRETDVVCRIGGEEFAVMACVSQREDAIKLARCLARQVTSLQIPTGQGADYAYISVSIGLAMFNGSGCSPSQQTVTAFVNEADEQLYCAKRNGRNCISIENSILPGPELPRKREAGENDESRNKKE